MNHLNILLIEDDPLETRLLREHLAEARNPGFRTHHTNHMKTGLERLAKGDIECILLDLGLPDSQGIETFLQIQEFAPHVPVVILAGAVDDALAFEAVRAGAQDYLEKANVNAYSLTRVILFAIERVRSRSSLRDYSQQLESEASSLIAESERSHLLLLALNQAAQAVQLARTPKDVFNAVGREIKALGLQAVVFEVNDDRSRLNLVHHTFKSRMLSAAEKLTGLTAWKYSPVIQPDGHHYQVITEGRTIYFKQMIEPMIRALPDLAQPTIHKFAAMLHIEQGIYAPMRVGDDNIGILVVIGSDMTESDSPAVTAFANQAAIALENARLHEETRTLAAELEQRVEKRSAELTASEARYRTLFDSQIDGLFVADMDGCYIDINLSACQMLGYSRQELLEMNVLDVGKRGKNLTGEARADLLEQLRVLWRQEGKGYQSELITKSGTLIPIEMSIIPLVYHGQEAVLGAVRDTTERLQVEESLRESEERYRLLAETAQDFIFIINRALQVDYVNNFGAAIFNRSPGELAGLPIENLFPGAEAQAASLIQVFQSGEPVYRESPIEFPGKTIWLGTRLSPIKDHLGNVTSVLGLARDITESVNIETERKQMEKALHEYSDRLEEMVADRTGDLLAAQEKLVRQEKLAVLGQLAGGLAHELRTPLNTIKNAAHYLEMGIEGNDADSLEMLRMLKSSVDNCDRIITSLLDYARPQFPNYQPIQLDEFIKGLISEHPVQENIVVEFDIEPVIPQILVDPNHLKIVFTNLISNAVQAMPAGGNLTIQARKNDLPGFNQGAISVAIIDTGFGVSPEHLERIFEPLFSTKTKGIGLGLAITKMLVEAHQGAISVESQPGRGSTFTVHLPAKRVNNEVSMDEQSDLTDVSKIKPGHEQWMIGQTAGGRH